MGRGGRRSSALLALALAAFVAHEASADKVDILQVRPAREAPLKQLVVARASFGGDLKAVTENPASDELLRLVYAQISSDCARIQSAELIGSGTAVLLDRGGPCSFAKKVKAVENAGSPLAIIGDTVAGAFASSRLTSQPIYDCSLGRGVAAANASSTEYPSVRDANDDGVIECSESGRCATNTCVYTGAGAGKGGGFEVCCFANTLVRMGADAGSLSIASQVAIPAVFVSYSDAQGLKHALHDNAAASVRAVSVEQSPWNVSMLLTWALGVAVAVGGAYCSATEERRYSYEKVALRLVPPHSGGDAIETEYVSIDDRPPSRGVMEDGDSDRIELSTRHALYFVVGSSAMLLLLYYGHFGLVVNVMFLVAATSALVQVATLPLVAHTLPLPTVEPSRREWIWFLLSAALALTLSLTWFVYRGSTWSWPLQDVLCVSLCFVVIDSIQLPSLRVATALLGLAFLYDIFFVYISPLVFGSSVMVDVASGNGLTQDPTASSTHEKMPMVITVPLLFSYYGGDALLGLGDIVLPGLLISFAIRYDYCMGYPISRQYFATASGSYAAGLLLANVAAVALRDVVPGQPALMYIVPLMLGAVTLRAAKQHELDELWDGPHCLRMPDPLVHGVRAAPRREEVEPFIKKMP